MLPAGSTALNHPILKALKNFEESLSDTVFRPSDVFAKMMLGSPGCHRNGIVKHIASLGTHMLLTESTDGEDVAQKAAWLILLFEAFMANTLCIGEDSRIGFRLNTRLRLHEQGHNLDSVRKLAKFFSKRQPCHCLDDLAKTAPRTAKCIGCDKSAESTSLMACSACGIVKYCSKECQVQDWPKHKIMCKDMQKDIEASNNDEGEEKEEDTAVPLEEAN